MARQTARICTQDNRLADKHTSKSSKTQCGALLWLEVARARHTARLGPILTHASGGCTRAPHPWLAG